jgi:glycosyltransferase involved in cell wall biosynthesis
MPSVSVIVPAYNSARYISQAVDSILEQTRIPDQIIIVNDGSTDDTRTEIQKYHDARLVYVEQENGGISAARNRGLGLARADYITFLDADDRWRPTMLEKQLTVLEAEPSLVCSFTNFTRFKEKTGQELGDQFQYYPLHEIPSIPGPIANSRILAGDPFCELVSFDEVPCFMQATIFRARLIEGMRFNEKLYLGEDYEFALRTYLRGRVAYNSELLADVRRHETNTTRDYHWFPVYKLQAFKSIEREVADEQQLVAFRDRLVKSHIDAACVHSERGQFGAALSVFIDGLSVPGSPIRKIKGAARLAVTMSKGRAHAGPSVPG